jgi:Ca2+/Na+ antiporter
MKLGVALGVVLLVGWALLAIVQLWAPILPPDMFIKVSVTVLILLVLLVIVILVWREYWSEQQMKKDGFIDG